MGAVGTAAETTVGDTNPLSFFYFLADFLFDEAHPVVVLNEQS